MINVLIAEDERLAREELVYLLEQEKDVTLCPSAENGDQLLTHYKEHSPDVLFLDIRMPGVTGIEIAEMIREENNDQQPLIVFTTAYDHYAVQAFELQAIDYLLKPFDQERFDISMQRVRTALNYRTSESKHKIDKLIVSTNEKMVVLNPSDIGFVERIDRTLKIHTLNNDVIETKMTLKELEEKLSAYPFYRPHRSYLVNLDAIEEITPWFNGAYNIVVRDSQKSKIPVSRTAAKEFFEVLQQ
ncbi:LytR/AlgR family response regulator transcription factor [Aquisalibacillus elongatus]|uniref:LytTR family two component transcriptional regulator n=1 Tax=Aquisalibacillus elongatus TaxID=485577 RepID=A0A3N5AYE0_9BACI|nr:LytTR family DNA-binding domain-containing protein [Aquisalibacillus elongatus]RPF50064.1 LytTR family two component transcriptional regulator [Aquisalibacillus elongatus]